MALLHCLEITSVDSFNIGRILEMSLENVVSVMANHLANGLLFVLIAPVNCHDILYGWEMAILFVTETNI